MDDPISTLALQIVQRASQPDVAVADLAALAEADAGFAARLLAVVNSPINGFSRRIVNVRQAASLLGARGLQNIALGLCVSAMTPLGPVGELLMSLHLRRACAARKIAEVARYPAPSDFFATGLLMELGLLMLARDQIDRVAPIARTPSSARLVRERAAGMEPHPFSGAALARKWHLPDDMVRAIGHHHEPKPPKDNLAKVAWIAERVAAVFEGGDASSLQSAAMGALGVIGLSREQCLKILEDLPSQVEEAGTALGRGVGKNPPLDRVLVDANARLLELNGQYQELIRTMENLLEEKQTLVEELKKANELLRELASTDSLTKLLNRRAFFEAAERDIARARRKGTPLGLILFDIDHFKKVNDTYGHQVGDHVLRAVGRAVKSAVRLGDVVGRYGGEEFGVVLPDAALPTAADLADRLRMSVAHLEVDTPAGPLKVTASFGVTSLLESDLAIAQLVRRADEALYAAKRAGRNCVASA